VRRFFVFLFLASIRLLARPFYRVRTHWLGAPAGDPWGELRVVCLLHHTSLFDWLWILAAPPRFLWRVASHGVVPAAEKTLNRPIVGFFFRSLAAPASATTPGARCWRGSTPIRWC
jgi:hypothetical protein